MSAPSDFIHEDDELPEDSREVVRSAFNHARKVLPDLDEQSFFNGFLYGMRFGGTAAILREFMGEAY